MITQEQVDRAYDKTDIQPRAGRFFFVDEYREIVAGCALGALALAHEIVNGYSCINTKNLQPFTGYDQCELGEFARGFDCGMQGWPTPPFESSKAHLNGYEIGYQKSRDLEESGVIVDMALA